MKKVLCGLVIALMMTGSGFAIGHSKALDEDQCDFLLKKAKTWISSSESENAMGYAGTKLINEKHAEFAIKDIKKAHYYAVTWSALCD